MSIAEAFKGAAFEIRDTPGGLGARLGTTARLAATIGRELGGLPALLPWATRARLDRARAPAPGRGGGDASVALARDVRYGPGARQVADVWVPPGWASASVGGGGHGGRCVSPHPPVALLVHGGVWSSGDKWTLGPAASALAAASGAAVAVPNYTLWPDGGSDSGKGGPQPGGLDAGAADIAAALGWALAGGVGAAVAGAAAGAGGTAGAALPPIPPSTPPPRVTLVGHSAGAHLAALAALAWSGGANPPASAAAPAAVVSLAGVFDLPAHYEYERGRGVHYLSTMARAAGGAVEWAADGGEEEGGSGAGGGGNRALRPRAPTPREAAGLEACSPTAILDGSAARWVARARPGLGRALAFRPARLGRVRWVLLAGGDDGTVPPSQSTAFGDALARAGVRGVACQVLPGLGHIDFVTGWGKGGGWTAAVAEVVRGV